MICDSSVILECDAVWVTSVKREHCLHLLRKEKAPGKLGIVKPYFLFSKTHPPPVSRQAIHTRSLLKK